MKSHLKFQRGFTLVELIFVAGFLIIVLVGMLQLFIYSSVLSELSGNMTLAMSEAQNKMEEMRNHSYDLIMTDYSSGGTPGNIFTLVQLTGNGVIYLDNSVYNATTDLLQAEIVVSWKNRDGRIVGEDKDLDGSLDVGEDINGDTRLSSPSTLTTLFSKR